MTAVAYPGFPSICYSDPYYSANDQDVVSFYTGNAGWPQQEGQFPPALVNTWDWNWWIQIGYTGEPGAYRQTATRRLLLRADGRYEFFAENAKVYSSWDLCPSGTGKPKGEREQEHDFGTFVVQGRDLILTVQQGTLSREDNCKPASNSRVSTAGQVTRLGWQVGLSPQGELLLVYDYAGGFLYGDNKHNFFSPQQPIAAANLFP